MIRRDRLPGAGGGAHGRRGTLSVGLRHQLTAVQAAIGKVVLSSHVQVRISDAMRSGDGRECKRKAKSW